MEDAPRHGDRWQAWQGGGDLRGDRSRSGAWQDTATAGDDRRRRSAKRPHNRDGDPASAGAAKKNCPLDHSGSHNRSDTPKRREGRERGRRGRARQRPPDGSRTRRGRGNGQRQGDNPSQRGYELVSNVQRPHTESATAPFGANRQEQGGLIDRDRLGTGAHAHQSSNAACGSNSGSQIAASRGRGNTGSRRSGRGSNQRANAYTQRGDERSAGERWHSAPRYHSGAAGSSEEQTGRVGLHHAPVSHASRTYGHTAADSAPSNPPREAGSNGTARGARGRASSAAPARARGNGSGGHGHAAAAGNKRQGFVQRVIEEGLGAFGDDKRAMEKFAERLADTDSLYLLVDLQKLNTSHPDLLQHIVISLCVDKMSVLLRLVDKVGDNAVTAGAYREMRRVTLQKMALAPCFLDEAARQLEQGRLIGHENSLTFLLLQAAIGPSGANAEPPKVRTSPDALTLAKMLHDMRVRGWEQLGAVFTSVTQTSMEDVTGTSLAAGAYAIDHAAATAAANTMDSMQALRAHVRPAGERNHDNDCANFRDIAIVPTPGELQDREPPYLPHARGDASCSGAESHVANQEAAHLDRLFRVMREDMVGPLKKELGEQLLLPAARQRRIMTHARLASVEQERGLHLKIAVTPTRALAARLEKMHSDRDRQDFLADGAGRRVLQQDTLLIFYNKPRETGQRERTHPPTGADLLAELNVVAIGVIGRRNDILGKAFRAKQEKETAEAAQAAGGAEDARNKVGRGGGRHASGRAWSASASSRWSPAASEWSGWPGRNRHAHSAAHRPPLQLYVDVSFPQLETLPAVIESAVARLAHADAGIPIADYVFAASASYFTYKPVLEGLQQLPRVPFADVLVPSVAPTAVMPLYGDQAEDSDVPERRQLAHLSMDYSEIGEEIRNIVAADIGQENALKLMTAQRVVLVQGPPGTGKTFVGVQMIKAMLEAAAANNNQIKVLCLCYTNHALDSFLESLLDAAVPEKAFVRLGSASKVSERLANRCLRNLPESRSSGAQSKLVGVLKEELRRLDEDIANAKKKLTLTTWGRSPRWFTQTVRPFLDEHDPVALEDLELCDFGVELGDGSQGQLPDEGELWMRWLAGESAGPYARDSCKHPASIWALSRGARLQCKEDWNQRANVGLAQRYIALLKRKSMKSEQVAQLHDQRRAGILSHPDIRIIGCTTIAAAKRQAVLTSLKPDVVLLEEAGEIFEAQVVTTVGHCQQLIMIGDHHQLRPKAENYDLCVEARNGHDINRSLFERLVEANVIPAATLEVQHRMRPEISRLPRKLTYPSLRDAEKTRTERPHVPGTAFDVAFITHNHLEEADTENAAVDSKSRVNRHEVAMVVAMARYLLQQEGVKPTDIVILVTYLGQASEVRSALLQADLGAELSHLDLGELARNDLLNGAPAPAVKQHVRVATVDNYQGEEAEFVLISTVRCNAERDIGFISGEQRVNVLLSRARRGMYIVGSLDTLTNARNRGGARLWSRIRDVIKAGPDTAVLDGFPAKCERHPSAGVQLLRTASDFAEHCPDGGCVQACSEELSCGHECPRKCHSGGHEHIPCNVKVDDICPYGHKLRRKCHRERPLCKESVSWKCARGHRLASSCHKGRSQPCAVCDKESKMAAEHELELQKAADEQARAAAEAEDAQTEAARRNTLNELSRETAALKHEATLARNASGASTDDPVASSNRGRREGKRSSRLRNVAAATMAEADAGWEHAAPSDDVIQPQHRSSGKQRQQQVVVDAESADADTAVDTGLADEVPATTMALASKSRAHSADRHNARPTRPAAPSEHASALREVFRAFNGVDGAMGAHDVLERRMNALASARVPPCFVAVEALLNWELTKELHPRPPTPPKHGSAAATGIGAAVVLLAAAIEHEQAGRPFYAQSLGDRAAATAAAVADALPAAWQQQADRLAAMDTTAAVRVQHKKQNITAAAVLKPAAALVPGSAAWRWQRELGSSRLPSLEKVMAMVGLEDVKSALLDLRAQVALDERRGTEGPSSYNVRFEGNPGTGKTTVARHYSALLKELKVLPEEAELLSLTASQVKTDGVKKLEGRLTKLKEVGGGVVFIDEAYQLSLDMQGKQILDFLLAHAESLEGDFGKLVFVLAGYKPDMEKLFEHNLGLPSRFPLRFIFADYSDEELLTIFQHRLEYTDKPKAAAAAVGQSPAAAPTSRAPRNTLTFNGYGGSLVGTMGIARNESPMQATPGTTTCDRFGNKWTAQAAGGTGAGAMNYYPSYGSQPIEWRDKHGNLTGYGPTPSVGTASNPVVASDGAQWLYDENSKTWTPDNNTSRAQTHYPGSKAPATTQGARQRRPRPFHCEETKYARMAMRRLGRRRGIPGFGNARAVRSAFDAALARQAQRLKQAEPDADPFLLTRDDLLGPRVTQEMLENSAAWRKLQAMEGLAPVKEAMRQLMQLVASNAVLEEEEKPLREVVLNRLFLGNPGTGKTTVAQLYGQILAELGLLSKGEMVFKTASDFKGDVLGASETTTRNILRAAEGCVLVIDEAYSLVGGAGAGGVGGAGSVDPYGAAVIDAIVEQVQARPGDDRAVLLLGYEKEMRHMLKVANPGLSRRFQLENAFVFPDYANNELLRILFAKTKGTGLNVSLGTAKAAVRQLAGARARPNFGNAGAVDVLLSQAKLRMQSLLQGAVGYELTKADFGAEGDGTEDTETLDSLLADMVGCNDAALAMQQLRDTTSLARLQGTPPAQSVSYGWLFLGRPGTGKTTVARKMGRMFKALGLLPTDEVTEASASDLVTGYLGQAGKRTREMMEQARGGVLFIDEAYQLNPARGGAYMTEAVDEIVKCMTHEDFQGKLLVVLAGYHEDMNEMLKTNPGLRSRFSNRIAFADFDAKTVVNVLEQKLQQRGIPLYCAKKHRWQLQRMAQRLCCKTDFGNGRDVATWAEKAYGVVAARLAQQGAGGHLDAEPATLLADAQAALDTMLASDAADASAAQRFAGSQQPGGPEGGMGAAASQPPKRPKRSAVTLAAPAPAVVEEEVLDDEADLDFTDEEMLGAAPEGTGVKAAFDKVDARVLRTLQEVLDEEGISTLAGVRGLTRARPGSPEFEQLVQRLVDDCGLDPEEAREQLRKWQEGHESLEDEEQEAEIQMRTRRVQAIWRCAVCGRADKPYIACYVAPYIVRYQPV